MNEAGIFNLYIFQNTERKILNKVEFSANFQYSNEVYPVCESHV